MARFGNWFSRALRGGITLAPAEQWFLSNLVSSLPQHLRPVVNAQLNSYNLAQREIDGRAINFYRRPAPHPNVPLLSSAESAPLVRLTASASGIDEPIHATLNAVSGRVFCMALSHRVQALPVAALQVTGITNAWRSNFPE